MRFESYHNELQMIFSYFYWSPPRQDSATLIEVLQDNIQLDFDWSAPTPNSDSSNLPWSWLDLPKLQVWLLQLWVCLYFCIGICNCILYLFWSIGLCLYLWCRVQRISCDQCDLFAVGLINGANVLSTGSHVDSLADEYLYLYFFVCGALYGANVLSSGSHSG